MSNISANASDALYNSHTGALMATTSALLSPQQIAIGPNGNLFQASYYDASVYEYNGTNGALVGTFVSSGSGGLYQSTGLAFAPNGNLYLVSTHYDNVLEYNGTTGQFIAQVVAPGSGGLASAFGEAIGNNTIYVSSVSGLIRMYALSSGNYLGAFSTAVPGGGQVTVGPGGDVFSASMTDNTIYEFNSTGSLITSDFTNGAGLSTPSGIAFLSSTSPVPEVPVPLMVATGVLVPWLARRVRAGKVDRARFA